MGRGSPLGKAWRLGVLFALAAPAAAGAANLDVNTTADTRNGADGRCSLREAVIASNTNTASGGAPGECAAGAADTDTIRLPDGDYQLSRRSGRGARRHRRSGLHE